MAFVYYNADGDMIAIATKKNRDKVRKALLTAQAAARPGFKPDDKSGMECVATLIAGTDNFNITTPRLGFLCVEREVTLDVVLEDYL